MTSQLEALADAVRGFGDTADGPLAAAHALIRQLDALGGETAGLDGPELQRMRGALDQATAEARNVVAALEEFRHGASAFADRLASGAASGGGGAARAVGSVALNGAALGAASSASPTGPSAGEGGDPERISSSRSPEFEPQPGGTTTAAAASGDPAVTAALGGVALAATVADEGTSLADRASGLLEADRAADQAAVDRTVGEAGASAALIASVHRDPPGVAPPTLAIRPPVRGEDHVFGSYTTGSNEIVLHPLGPHPRLTYAHENGHRLDDTVLRAPGGLGSLVRSDPLMGAWFDAVRTSPEYRELQAMQATFPIGDPFRKTADYLISPAELWGRSYAQFVAQRSGDPELLAEVRSSTSAHDRGTSNSQWSMTSFSSIGAAIEAVLRGKGLL